MKEKDILQTTFQLHKEALENIKKEIKSQIQINLARAEKREAKDDARTVVKQEKDIDAFIKMERDMDNIVMMTKTMEL